MDVGIVTTLIAGTFTTVGIILNRIDKIAAARAAESHSSTERETLVNAEVWRLVEALRQDRDDLRKTTLDEKLALINGHEQKMADLQSKLEDFQDIYHETIERLESLEVAKIEDAKLIKQLQTENERLRGQS